MGALGNVPEPTGPPEPVLDGGGAKGAGPSLGGTLAHLGELVAIVAVAGGAAYFLAGAATMRHTSGATRSAQLTWQQLRAEVEQAVTEAEGPGAADAAAPARGVE
jgi:hypothetical protein